MGYTEKDRSIAGRVGKGLLVGSDLFADVLWLALRLYWGYTLAQTGWGKLHTLDKVTGYFESLHIPLPHLNAMLAGLTEFAGGTALALGALARVAAIPVAVTMCVALATAFTEELKHVFEKPDAVIGADPFLFLLVALLVIARGPGLFSLDALLAWLSQSGIKRLMPLSHDVFHGLWLGRDTARRVVRED
jgi:putative oxidoreductase